MSVGINANSIYASIRDRNQHLVDSWANDARQNSVSSQSAKNQASSSTRAMEYQQRIQDRNRQSVINQSMSYADALKASRTKNKESNLEKKKLQYSYKKISSQIVRSKTSLSARKAASAARREVQRLKRLRSSGEYDEEELQISIEHAKSMERIAKKKVAHLQQEEMIERGQNGAMAALEEKEEEKQEESEDTEDELSEEDQAALEELDPNVYYPEEYADGIQAATEHIQEEMEYRMAEIQAEMEYHMEELAAQMQQQIAEIHENTTGSMDELSEDMLKMMSDAMEEMTEELDLTELANTIVAPDPNMSEDDLKMLKMKHRTKEMQDIAKADGEYLKSIMDKYEKKGVAGLGFSGGAVSGTPAFGSASSASFSPTPITVSVPAAYGSGGSGMSFDAFA